MENIKNHINTNIIIISILASIYIKMSETFQKVLIKDDRIGNVTDAVKYCVFKGAQNVTSYIILRSPALPHRMFSTSPSLPLRR